MKKKLHTAAISTIERNRILDAIDLLISGKNGVLQAVIDGIAGKNVRARLDEAHGQVRTAAHNLEKYHPDATKLPIGWWGACGNELGIFADPERVRNSGMKGKKLTKYKSDWIQSWRAGTEEVIGQLRALRQSLCKGGKANPCHKYCYEQRKKGTAWKTIMAHVNARGGWYPLGSIQSVRQAARLHADKFALPWPPR